MTRFGYFAAALAAVVSLPVTAQAVDQNSLSGHYEWLATPQAGPRTPLAAPRRLWVPDGSHVADCDCAMMKAHASDCMTSMFGMAPERHRAG